MSKEEIEKFEKAYNYWINDHLDDAEFSVLTYNFINKTKELQERVDELIELNNSQCGRINSDREVKEMLRNENKQLQARVNELITQFEQSDKMYSDLLANKDNFKLQLSDEIEKNKQLQAKIDELEKCSVKLIDSILKHHKTISIPEQEDLYMSLHDLKNKLTN